jgi:hypothetical protein
VEFLDVRIVAFGEGLKVHSLRSSLSPRLWSGAVKEYSCFLRDGREELKQMLSDPRPSHFRFWSIHEGHLRRPLSSGPNSGYCRASKHRGQPYVMLHGVKVVFSFLEKRAVYALPELGLTVVNWQLLLIDSLAMMFLLS